MRLIQALRVWPALFCPKIIPGIAENILYLVKQDKRRAIRKDVLSRSESLTCHRLANVSRLMTLRRVRRTAAGQQ
jgi:hypothetical protein